MLEFNVNIKLNIKKHPTTNSRFRFNLFQKVAIGNKRKNTILKISNLVVPIPNAKYCNGNKIIMPLIKYFISCSSTYYLLRIQKEPGSRSCSRTGHTFFNLLYCEFLRKFTDNRISN